MRQIRWYGGLEVQVVEEEEDEEEAEEEEVVDMTMEEEEEFVEVVGDEVVRYVLTEFGEG